MVFIAYGHLKKLFLICLVAAALAGCSDDRTAIQKIEGAWAADAPKTWKHMTGEKKPAKDDWPNAEVYASLEAESLHFDTKAGVLTLVNEHLPSERKRNYQIVEQDSGQITLEIDRVRTVYKFTDPDNIVVFKVEYPDSLYFYTRK